jgi:hypothetical protein
MNVGRFFRVLTLWAKPNRLTVKLGLLGSMLMLLAFIPRDEDPLGKLVTTLQRWTDTISQEKVYLHTDKPYYALGDTIWFKGYVTIGSRHQLSALSGSLYVDLITEKDSIIRSLKLPVTSGMVMGNFILGDDFKEGSYRIRSYTQWMRNAGEDYFFDRTFTIGNPANEKPKTGKGQKNLTQSDVQFFPESGSLVNGISSKVAFKAVGVDGLGAAIKAKIIDNANNEVTEIETLHAGMGSFLLRSETGKTYSAQVSFADGSTKTIALPKALDEGYVLSVYQPNKDSVLVRINASAAMRQSSVNFIAQTGGETIFASPVKIASTVTSIWLEKKSFPTGIAQFTLFNSNGEPLNERIAFIRSNDLMQLNLKTAKSSYKSKERILVDLIAKDSKGNSVPGNFSVAVIDESKVPMEESLESTIFSNILLTSDLKGYIEKPNYYFTAETDEVNKALDNLMLTQGYRRFTWKELANTVNAKPLFPAEGLGVTISGTVQTLGHKILPGASVMLMSLKAGVTKGTTTDENGRFKFDGIFMTDSIKFAIQARTAKNGDKVKIILDSIPKKQVGKNKNIADIISNKAYIETAKTPDGKPLQLNQLHTLKQVEIKAKKISTADLGVTPQGMYKITEGSADKVITFLPGEAERLLTLKMALEGRLPGISVGMNDDGSSAMIDMRDRTTRVQLFVDGRKITTSEEISEILEGSILPEDVAKIEMVRTNRAMVSFLGGVNYQPSVLILTKLGTTRKQYNPSIANVSPKGFNKVREFYSPRYDKPGNADKLPDLRSTIYWNPYLKTDVNGKTVFNYFNADGPGNYKVIVEGINAAGELGRQVYRYSVEAGQTNISALTPPAADKSLALITAPLDSFNKRLPVEKVYVHTDKPYYNLGDTLWFKSYLVDRINHMPSQISGLLYIELDNDSAEMVRRVSIRLKDGIGSGQIPLSKLMFREGTYTLRAYTNWMQNFGIGSGRPLSKIMFGEGTYALRPDTNWMLDFREHSYFNQQIYIGAPSQETWLVKSTANLSKLAGKDQLEVELKLNHDDKLLSPMAYRKLEVKIYDQSHYIYNEQLQTGVDGSLKFSQAIKDYMDGRQIRVQISSLDKADHYKVVQIPLVINRNQNIDLQFLPEGGNLVTGLKSTIGFKAVGEDGKGTPVLGSIVDSKGREVVSFAALHNGMGSFEFVPKPGEIYSARISEPVVKSFVLPKINATGTTMHISNPEKSETVGITLCATTNATDSACYLIGTSRGVIYYSQKVELNQPEIAVSKKLFPSGIARFTLFKGKTPLNERAVFIDNNDQLTIKVTPNKTAYRKRDSVNLAVEVKDKNGYPVAGSFSLAVTDDSQVKADSLGNNGIMASLLINSELKGYVESPGYYVNRKNKQAWQALDNLMLTQGWTNYEWKDVFAPAKPVIFKAEREFKITGRVTNVFSKPVPGSSVLVSSQKPQFITTTNSDADGRFVFENLPTIDSGSFFIQASNAKGKKMTFGNVSVEKFTAPGLPVGLKNQILPWYINTDSIQLNYARHALEKANEKNFRMTGNVLKEVTIKDKKIIKITHAKLGAGEADIAFDEQDIKKSGAISLYGLLQQKVPGFKLMGARLITFRARDCAVPVINFNGYGVDLRIDGWPVVLDMEIPGLPVGSFDFDSIIALPADRTRGRYANVYDDALAALSDIKIANLMGLEITYTRKQIDRITKVHLDWDLAVIDITTKNGTGGDMGYKQPDVATYRPLPVMEPTQFYSPKYNITPSSVTEPDYRSTLYWEPNITTNQNGKANVSFYTSDIKGAYTIKVSGVDVNGGIGDGTFKINQIKHENP